MKRQADSLSSKWSASVLWIHEVELEVLADVLLDIRALWNVMNRLIRVVRAVRVLRVLGVLGVLRAPVRPFWTVLITREHRCGGWRW